MVETLVNFKINSPWWIKPTHESLDFGGLCPQKGDSSNLKIFKNSPAGHTQELEYVDFWSCALNIRDTIGKLTVQKWFL